MYLITYMSDGDFAAEFMNIKQIASLYGCSDCNETSDHKVYLLTQGAEPERLVLQEEWEKGLHMVVLRTQSGMLLDGYEWPEH